MKKYANLIQDFLTVIVLLYLIVKNVSLNHQLKIEHDQCETLQTQKKIQYNIGYDDGFMEGSAQTASLMNKIK